MMKNKKYARIFKYLISLSSGIICFSIIYLAVFAIQEQTPDNHLGIYNFFGIFYKDLFIAGALGQLTAMLVYSISDMLLSKQKIRCAVRRIISALFLSASGGWFCAWAGNYLSSGNSIRFSAQLMLHLMVSAVNITILYLIGNRSAAGEYEL